MLKRNFKYITTIVLIAGLTVLALGCGSSPQPAQPAQAAPTQAQPAQADPQQAQPAQPAQPAAPAAPARDGRGMRLAILSPQSQGLAEHEEYLPAMIQGVLVANISNHSSISVLDRVSLDRVIIETLDLTYEDDMDIVRLGSVAQVRYILSGNIIRTATGFSLHFNVTETTAQANTIASFAGTTTVAELDDHSAIHRASLELLSQMGVQVGARARTELGRASAAEVIDVQAALARGVTADRRGDEITALSHYLRAMEINPFLAETEARLNIISASIERNTLGTDARADILWRNQWMTRLRETEEFMARFSRETPLYYLVYFPSIEQGEINFANETITLNMELRVIPDPAQFITINQLTQTIRNGLQATGRAEAWGLNWPAQTLSTPSPFFADNAGHTVVVEILDDRGAVIARQNVGIRSGGWFKPEGGSELGIIAPFMHAGIRAEFPGVDVNALTDNLSVRIASIDGIPAQQVTSRLGIRVLPQQEFNRIRSVTENGLHTENLRQFTINFDRNRNIVRGYTGVGGSVAIPYGVTLIDGDSRLRGRGVSGVTIPPTVTIIGDNAFRDNLLTRVNFPDSITSIGSSAFRDNANLTAVTIGGNVSIGSNVLSVSGLNDNSFRDAYNNNNRRAGTYTSPGGFRPAWSFNPR